MSTTRRSSYSEWSRHIAGIQNSEDVRKLYIEEWNAGNSPPLTWPDLERMVRGDSSNSQLLADLARSNSEVKKSIAAFRTDLLNLAADDDDAFKIIFAIEPDLDIASSWRSLEARLPVETRVSILKGYVCEKTRLLGREQTRDDVFALWRVLGLLEEEREALVEAAIQSNVMEWTSLPLLGPEAQAIARRLIVRGEINLRDLGPNDMASMPIITGRNGIDEFVSQAVSSLAQSVTIRSRLAGARFTTEEMDRLETSCLHPIFTLLAFDRRTFRHPMIEELFHAFRHEWPRLLFAHLGTSGLGDGIRPLNIPLIRLLHMRLLLDTSSLGSSLLRPEDALVPEVMLHLLRQDGVAYTPEIRLAANTEKGWRRRWAETTGEALSSLFLEDALALDLTTLIRIPESSESTPDFMARSFAGEHIVFESKGATSWDSFRKSKRKALKQLAKTGPAPMWQDAIAWDSRNKGRSFACCLFAACDDAAEPSQFHVEDPAFSFDWLFHEGWEAAARRRHYVGVLQAARLFEDAALLGGTSPLEPTHQENETFRLALSDDVSKDFTGSYVRPWEVARALAHPRSDSFRSVRLFIGIEASVLDGLRQSRLPQGRPFGLAQRQRNESSPIPPYGLLPGWEDGEPPRGVYSRLSAEPFLPWS